MHSRAMAAMVWFDGPDALAALGIAIFGFYVFVAINIALLLAIGVRLFVVTDSRLSGLASDRRDKTFVVAAAILFAISVASTCAQLQIVGRPIVIVYWWISFLGATLACICAWLGKGRGRLITVYSSLFVALCWGVFLYFMVRIQLFAGH